MNDCVSQFCLDQRRRWLRGERPRVETYLERQPALLDQPDVILDLIYNEIVLREETGETPALADYLKRFPQFADQLRVQFKVHEAIERPPLDKTIVTPPGQSSSVAAAPKPNLPGYELLGEIGRGGMGVVYRARQLSLNRLVALKMILAGSHASPHEVKRFRTEAEAVARLQHPNIVQIYEIGEQEGLPYLALELVDGPSLDKEAERKPLAPRAAAQLVETLAKAMHHVHQQGIVHRDLKPANVLLASAPGSKTHRPSNGPVPDLDAWETGRWIPKLTDFGLAKLSGDTAGPSPTKTMVGTPNYMAPEQAAGPGTPVGPPADVYALGAILYELLAQRPPFHGKSILDVLEKVRSQDPVEPRRLNGNAPRDLETICLKCLKKEPSQRYATALDLAEDLRRFLGNEPIAARRAGLGERTVKWTKRRPALAGLLAVASVAAVSLAVVNLRHGLALEATEDQARAAERQEQFERLQQARAAYRAFADYRGDALFHWSLAALFPDSDAPGQLSETRTAAHKALALVDLSRVEQTSPQLSPYWSQREKAEVVAGCYQLFLVLADATANPKTRQVPEAERESARQGLRVLDRAAKAFPPTQALHVRRARYLAQLGDEVNALRELRLGASMPPSTFSDHLLAGDEHYQRGDIQAAAQSFQTALVLEPSDFWSQCFLAICQLKLKHPAEAAAGLTKCVAQRPDFLWPRLLRGLAYGELNDFAAAEVDFAAALERRPTEDVRYVVHVSRGLLRFRRKQWDEAVIDLQDAIALKPHEFHARVSLAKVYQAHHQLDKSNEQLALALDLHPTPAVEAECHVEQSRNLYFGKRYREAVSAAETAVQILPGYAEAYQLRGLALLELKRFGEALQSFDRYLALAGTPGPDFYRARGSAKMQLRDYLGAVEDYTRAAEAAPDSEVLAHRGWAYWFADAWRPALRDFDEAIRLDAKNGDAYTGRGLARVMLGNVGDAVADADEAIRRQPRTPEMMHNVACIFALAASGVQKIAADGGLAANYRERALQAVRKTLEMVPAEERPAFWRDRILPDTALDAIRHSPGFKELVERYSSLTSALHPPVIGSLFF
jgi:eukaryotic-like serine/threonine-protein kinase